MGFIQQFMNNELGNISSSKWKIAPKAAERKGF